MATKKVALGNKGKGKQSLPPMPNFSPRSMSSASAMCGGIKCKKNKRERNLIPAGLGESLGEVAVEGASEACIPFLPSSSSMALSLQTVTAGPSSNKGSSLLEATAPLSEGTEKEEIPRKHCGESVHSVKTDNQSRPAASTSGVLAGVESIELDQVTADEIVDLTGDSAESVVVDLTCNDSVMLVEENGEWQNSELKSQQLPDSLILSSDDDSELKGSNVFVASKWRGDCVKDNVAGIDLQGDRFTSSRPSGTVSCPICLEGYSEIVYSGRLIVSTKCGHIFCSQCLRNSLRNTSSCPTCRKKLNHKQYHPIYI